MADATDEQPVELPPFQIEPARSGRSKCKACRRAIPKGALRFGVLIEGPFGQGYLWHHLNCAAKRQFERVEQAYEERCWEAGLDVPELESLRKLAQKAETEKRERKTAPFVERAPTGRSKCKHCGETVPKDDFRVGMLRKVEFYGQVRHAVVNVHPQCVAGELEHEDSAVERADLARDVRANSRGLEAAEIDEALRRIGSAATG